MMSDETKPFAIILFLPRKSPALEQIEIIPCSWLKNDSEKSWCRFPPEKDYKNVESWCKCLKKPKKTWQYYEVEILDYAKDWVQAERRMNRAYTSSQIQSTDEDNNVINTPEILPEKKVASSLGKVTSMAVFKSTVVDIHENEADNNTLLRNDDERPSVSANREQAVNRRVTPRCPINECSNFDQLMEALEKEEENVISNMDPILKPLQEYIELLFRKQTLIVRRAIESSKVSLMYDLTKNTRHLQNHIIANSSTNSIVPICSLQEAKKSVDENFPIRDLNAFKSFDSSLSAEDKNTYDKFLNLIRVCTFGQTKIRDCVRKIFPEILTKAVELEYSGTGKKIHGVGKLNFSETNTFKCIESIIREKFPDQPEAAKLRSIIGTWLSGAPDRERGRALRMTTDNQRQQHVQ